MWQVEGKKVGLGTIFVGAVDWYARYQTGRDLWAWASNGSPVKESHWWVSPAIIIVGFGILFWERIAHIFTSTEELPHPSASNSSSASNSGNPSANAVGGAGGSVSFGDIHIGVPAAAPPTILPAPEPTKTRSPNLKCIGARTIFVQRSSSNKIDYFEETASQIGTKGLVVAFRNEELEEGDVCSAFEVEARLRFRNSDGAEINTGVDNACWLDNWKYSMDIGVEEAKHVVLLIRQSDGYTYIPFRRPSQTGTIQVNRKDVYKIDIKLIDGRYSNVIGNTSVILGDALKPTSRSE
ncbi:MAG: hypothetical protein ACRD3B_08275 [Candidatus Sulfotelmatobacter sp.]